MTAEELRALQAPLKDRYRADPTTARVTLRAEADLDEGIACRVETGRALVRAGLHPATGGNGELACSGDMLLQAPPSSSTSCSRSPSATAWCCRPCGKGRWCGPAGQGPELVSGTAAGAGWQGGLERG